MVPGWGEKKVKIWCGTMRENFRVRRAAKAGINMLTTETAAGSVYNEELNGQTARSNLQAPIPIGMIPSREASGQGLSRENTIPESSHKRRRLEQVDVSEPNSDEEAALLAEAEQASVNMLTTREAAPGKSGRQEPELSEGVKAALAKLRDKG